MKPTLQTHQTDTIDAVVEAMLLDRRDKAASISPYYEVLWREIERLLGAGGKRLRSRITVLSYRMFGGADVAAVLPAAAAIELLHLGMLIHDDIIDRDYVRYGVDNIAGAYRKTYKKVVSDDSERLHYADSAAILGGDLMISEAYLMMAESTIDARTVLGVQKLLGTSIFEVIGGELIDTEAAFRKHGTILAETIAQYKTASYTVILPMLVGAQLAGVSEVDQLQVRIFGRNLGIAFQLRDDVIGVFGDESKTGKSTMGDLREGKRTYMIEQFYLNATQEQVVEFDEHFGNSSLSEANAARLRNLLIASGAVEKTEQAIDDYEANARAAIAQLTIHPEYHEQLNDLIAAMTKRVM